MMHQLSDSDSVDSDEGVRFKTESIRNKYKDSEYSYSYRKERPKSPVSRSKDRSRRDYRRRSPSVEDEYRRDRRKEKKSKHSKKTDERRKDVKEPRKTEEKVRTRNEVSTVVGPALPPHLVKTPKVQAEAENKESSVVGPSLPSHLLKTSEKTVDKEKNVTTTKDNIIGPSLPLHLIKSNSEESEINNTEETKVEFKNMGELDCKSDEEKMDIGPALPSNLMKKSDGADIQADDDDSLKDYIGPSLPPHLLKNHLEEIPEFSIKDSVSDSEDDEVYGPLPVGEVKNNPAHIALEERALQLKLDKLTEEDTQPAREEWMLELPEVKASNLGLGPRQFRSKTGPDMSDRSSWTDTPQTKGKKKKKTDADIKKEAEIVGVKERDKEQEAVIKKHKRSKESLVEIHQKKLKNEKSASSSNERKPFNRETDLQVNRFDEAQKKAVLKKAQLLDDRFSSGQSKFL